MPDTATPTMADVGASLEPKPNERWLKILGGGGLAIVLALWLVSDLRKANDADRTFIQGEFMEVLKDNTVATVQQTAATQMQTVKQTEVLSKLDELCDSHKDLCKEQARQSDSIDRLMQKVWNDKATIKAAGGL